MRKYVSALAVITALFGCDDDDDEVIGVREWQTSLVGIGEGTALRGESEVSQSADEDQFTASIDLRNDVPGSVRPWHVHFGTCGSGGDIVGADEDYPRLVIEEDGSASARATIQETLEPGSPYHVNVHRSDEDFDTIIACGDLTLATIGLDAGVVSDAAIDAGVPDAAVARDAAVTPDAATTRDAALAPDASTRPDATVARDAASGTDTVYP